jgi:hypothetical protein
MNRNEELHRHIVKALNYLKEAEKISKGAKLESGQVPIGWLDSRLSLAVKEIMLAEERGGIR